MLFSKTVEPRCAYCDRSVPLDNDTVACVKKGVVSAGSSCGAFRYDPLRRVPPRTALPDFIKLRDEDFSL